MLSSADRRLGPSSREGGTRACLAVGSPKVGGSVSGEGERIVVVVTGLPASGKTTLSRRLSEALNLPLLSKDLIKESLFDVLGVNDRAWSLQLGAAAMEVLWSVLRECPGGAVLDLWLDPRRDADLAQRGLARAGIGTACEILCECPADVAVRRYAARFRHVGHLPPDDATLQRIRDAEPLMAPLGIGPTRRVDTTTAVDLTELSRWLRAPGSASSANGR